MSKNAANIDESIKLILEKLSEEFEIVKRQVHLLAISMINMQSEVIRK